MIPIVRVNLRRAVGDRRLLFVATLFPILFILVTGLLAGSPKEPIGLVHPSARLVQLVARTGDLKVRIEPDRAQLGDDILRGRVVAGLIALPAPPGTQRVDFVSESASTSAIQARTDVVALLDLIAAEGTHTTVTDVTLAHADVPAALSPFSYVAPADLVLFLGITVLLLSSGVVESRRLGLMNRLAAAPVRRRSVVAALIATSLCVAAVQCVGLLVVGRLLFGVHWGNPARRLPRPRHAVARLRRRRRAREHALAHRGAGDLPGRRAGHRVRHAGRLHVPARRGRTGGPRRRPRRCRRPGPWMRSSS